MTKCLVLGIAGSVALALVVGCRTTSPAEPKADAASTPADGGDTATTDATAIAFDGGASPALQIVQVQVLEAGNCSLPTEPTSVHRVSGMLDVDLPDRIPRSYVLPVLVANLLPSSADAGAELNNLTLTHFTVELSAPGVAWPSACPATFDTPTFTSLLVPGATTGVKFDVLTAAHATCLATSALAQPLMVTAEIWAKGRHGGTSIGSMPFFYTVYVCRGCLQQGYGDPALAPYSYPADFPLCSALTGANPYAGDPCLSPGQDATILCCGVTSASAICPGVFTGSSSTATGR